MSEFYTIAVMFRGGQRQVNLVYQSKGAAEEVWDRMVRFPDGTPRVSEEDSYGSRLVLFHDGSVEAILLQDVGRAQEVQIEMALLQARAQSKADTRAAHDPMIKRQSNIVPGGDDGQNQSKSKRQKIAARGARSHPRSG